MRWDGAWGYLLLGGYAITLGRMALPSLASLQWKRWGGQPARVEQGRVPGQPSQAVVVLASGEWELSPLLGPK